MISASPLSRATFAVILTWPEVKNAEYEVVQRLCIAAANIGARVTIVDNDGYPIWSTFKNVDPSDPRIDRDQYDFVISLHFESPRLFDIPSYSALWNPLEFYFMFGYEKSVMKLVSHNDALSCDSDLADNHALNLFRGLGRPVADLPKLFHSPPEPYLPPTITESAKLFYIGINWERLGGPKGRHHDLLETLDEEDLIAIYGPDVFQGGRPWEGFKTYRGPIPFDGRSVVKRLNEAGICLALSSKAHQQSGIMSNRLFEGLAAGTVVIANKHPIIDKYFSDCVYVIDDDRLDSAELRDLVRDLIISIRRNPEEGQRRAQIGQQRLAEMFSLERSLETLVATHGERSKRNALLPETGEAPNVTVILLYTQTSRKEFGTVLENVLRQEGVAIDLVCVCDRRLAEDVAGLIEEHRPRLRSIRMETRDFYGLADFQTKSAQRLRGTGPVLHALLAAIETEFFAVLGRDDHWFSDHLVTTATALARMPGASMAASGLLVEEAAENGRTARRIEELAFTQHEALLNVTGSIHGGRFVFRREIGRNIRPETMALLDGEEAGLLGLKALLTGQVGQTNYATYVSLAHERWKRPQPVVPAEQQHQFIRDSVTGDRTWQAMRVHAIPVSATLAPSPVQWERYALPTAAAPLVQPNRLYRVAAEGNGLRYLGKGFSRPEGQHVWIDDDSAEIRFQLADYRENVSLRLTCWARPVVSGYQRQGFTVTLNDLPLAYAEIDQTRRTLSFPLPPKLVGASEDFKIAIVPDWPEPIKDATGAVLDGRRLSIALADFAVVCAAPRVKLDEVLETKAGAAGLPLLIDGFSTAEPEAIWIDGTHAALALQIDDVEDGAAELVLDLTGRAANDGHAQCCTVSVNGVRCSEVTLTGNRQTVVLPLPAAGYPDASWHVELDFASAEPVVAADGSILDPRKLSALLHSIMVRRSRPD